MPLKDGASTLPKRSTNQEIKVICTDGRVKACLQFRQSHLYSLDNKQSPYSNSREFYHISPPTHKPKLESSRIHLVSLQTKKGKALVEIKRNHDLFIYEDNCCCSEEQASEHFVYFKKKKKNHQTSKAKYIVMGIFIKKNISFQY